METNLTISKLLAPEDITPGDYVAVLHISVEYFNAYCDPMPGSARVQRVSMLPKKFSALRVVSVCLPFVLTEDSAESPRTLDVRRHTLARLTEDFGKKAMKRTRRAAGAGRPDPG